MHDIENLITTLKLLNEASSGKAQVQKNPELEPELPFLTGKPYIIRSATMTNVGRVKKICGGFLVLEDAAWVADTGRYFDALSTGVLNEVEPYPDGCFVAVTGIIDAAPWNHSLPLKQK